MGEAAAVAVSAAVEAVAQGESGIAGKAVTLIERQKGCHGSWHPFFFSIEPLVRPGGSRRVLFLQRFTRRRGRVQCFPDKRHQR